MKKQSKTYRSEKPNWKPRMGDSPAVRRTFEVVIMQVWHCDSRAAELEFDRALSVGEVETFGIVGTQMAYKCKM
jgi:hypothetical protein